ncbi:hypothetical protein J2Y45_001251 [Dyadobacter sp. BE34]|uniref:Uncharacterized protein n=1 Tax=Dyadobacter fermentans TaxID=94254 RepID=A0ABU1QS56_9BACT|nr:hypothetical protein [Dyadobacter fermentans]MDR7041722.1 hypothetical protein [Dyadobacter sp. BE242]MDR7196125.1 hypothetical protein [Dyadobacter sp. BE34]MDR7213330.1 hypothetical protein [Dyadobacter sp. BE31]MDR7261531.1 hypothetical protein [Dyadobacter sp. BE32]
MKCILQMTAFYSVRFRGAHTQSINAIRPRFISKTSQKMPEKRQKGPSGQQNILMKN